MARIRPKRPDYKDLILRCDACHARPASKIAAAERMNDDALGLDEPRQDNANPAAVGENRGLGAGHDRPASTLDGQLA
jgi:hypothetical protein